MRTSELWGRIHSQSSPVQREATRTQLIAEMRANTRVLWGLQPMAVPCNDNTYYLGHTAGAAVVDGVYGQVEMNPALAVLGDAIEVENGFVEGGEVGTLVNLGDQYSCAVISHWAIPNMFLAVKRGNVRLTYAEMRSALQNANVGWDRFSGLVIARALFSMTRKWTVTVTAPFVAGEVFEVTETDAPNVMEYTVIDGDTATDVAAGLMASLADASLYAVYSAPGVFVIHENVTPDWVYVERSLGIDHDSAGGDMGMDGETHISTMVWAHESERQNATLFEITEPWGTVEPIPQPTYADAGSALYDGAGDDIELTDQNTWYVFADFTAGDTIGEIGAGATGLTDLPQGMYDIRAHGSFDLDGAAVIEMAVCENGVAIDGLKVRDTVAAATTGANFGISLNTRIVDGASLCFRVRRTSAIARDVKFLVLAISAQRIRERVVEE